MEGDLVLKGIMAIDVNGQESDGESPRASDFSKEADPNEPLVDQIVSMLEFKGTLLGPNSLELAEKHRKIAKILVEASMYEKALPHCLKALEIYTSLNQSREANSSWVNNFNITRRLLAVIYTGLEDYEEACLESILAFHSSLISCEMVLVEIDYIRIKISRGDYDTAMKLLEVLVSKTDDSGRVVLYIEKAQILIGLKKYADLKIFLEISFDILEKLESVASIDFVTTSYMKIAQVCKKRDKLKIDNDMSMLEKSMIKLEKLGQTKDLRWDLAFLIGKLKLRIGMGSEAIGYFLTAESNFKNNFGSKHSKLGKIYACLGKSFSDVGDHRLAIHMLKLAKENFDVSLGPDHWNSIEVCENLSTAYCAIKRYGDAIELLEQVIEALAKKQGPNGQDQLRKAHQHLKEVQSNEVTQSFDSTTFINSTLFYYPPY